MSRRFGADSGSRFGAAGRRCGRGRGGRSTPESRICARQLSATQGDTAPCPDRPRPEGGAASRVPTTPRPGSGKEARPWREARPAAPRGDGPVVASDTPQDVNRTACCRWGAGTQVGTSSPPRRERHLPTQPGSALLTCTDTSGQLSTHLADPAVSELLTAELPASTVRRAGAAVTSRAGEERREIRASAASGRQALQARLRARHPSHKGGCGRADSDGLLTLIHRGSWSLGVAENENALAWQQDRACLGPDRLHTEGHLVDATVPHPAGGGGELR